MIFRLSRLMGAKGPGLFFIIPGIARIMMKIDLRVITMVVEPHEVISRDNVTLKVNAMVYFKVVYPNMAVVKVMDYIRATSQVCQTTPRSVLGQSNLDELLAQRDQLSQTPTALQLRYMQTLTEIAVEKNFTIIFLLPMDLITAMLPHLAHGNGKAPAGEAHLSLESPRSTEESQ